ncbi:transglycosylase SLT domain-containing protein [Pontitalea aquivivens]|uniref:transglycosylase SLT domain-containing protein n=1 Tax=Pontitalea aquivivens TaxID=3388663 RepID=UPI003970F1F6
MYKMFIRAFLGGLSALWLGVLCTPSVAAGFGDTAICDVVARRAAETTGVPVDVLLAISRTETGRKAGGQVQPWPWTVNMEGAGHWFDTLDEARAFVFKEFKRGARSFDVGCFQINYKWHGEAFSSIDEMFEPMANALYAARFLDDLYQEMGSWPKAAGAYHSRTPEYAQRYTERFNRFRNQLAAAPLSPAGATTGAPPDIPEIPDIVLAARKGPAADLPYRENRYPLLRRQGTQAPSLGAAAGASLFAAALQERGE